MDIPEKNKEILFFRDKVYQLKTQVSILQKRIKKHQRKPRYTLREKTLYTLAHGNLSPRRKIAEHLGIFRSTVYRWLHKIQDDKKVRIPANKTPKDIVALVWEIAKSNMSWGRVRIANQLALLNAFISASTVRNILQKSKHPVRSSTKRLTKKKKPDQFLLGIPITSVPRNKGHWLSD